MQIQAEKLLTSPARPAHTLFQVVFEKFRLESLQEVVTGTLVVVICVRHLHLAWRVADFFWFLLMVICGAVICLAVFLILTSVSLFGTKGLRITAVREPDIADCRLKKWRGGFLLR